MARKNDKTVIPEVDAIKAGIDTSAPDKFDEFRDSEGYIKITRSNESKQLKEKVAAKLIASEEEKLNKLKEKLASIGVKTASNDEDSKIEELRSKKKLSKKEKKKLAKLEKKEAKNKKDSKLSYEDTMLDAIGDSDFREHIMGIRSGKKKDKNKKLRGHDESEDSGMLAGLSKKTKIRHDKDKDKDKEDKKEKVEKSEVAESFKEVEKLTKENMKEIDNTIKIVDTQLKEMTSASSRIRGRETAISNYLQAKSSLINAKQSAIKDILNTRVKVHEIELKKNKDKNEAGGNSHVELLARVFPGILADKNLSAAVTKEITDSGKNKDSKNKKKWKKGKGKDSDVDDALMRREKELLKSGDIAYNAYDANIEYEGKFTIAIKKAWTTGDWIFCATDRQGNFIDVPKKLLPKKSSTSMKWDDQNGTARDENAGMVYKVYDVPTF